MKKKIILTLLASCCLVSTIFLTQKETEPYTDFYNSTFLRNSQAVEKILKEQGFFEVDFKTHDNMTINAIMLDQSNAKEITTTIISFPGFVPGRKEGMSTLYAMLQDQPYNFVFLDSRGHGKSDGELLTFNGIKHYGEDQYLDMMAAVKFISNYNKKHNIKQNIIIHGLCAGAFHTVKAVAKLKTYKDEAYHAIKGIIFDSGWPAIVDIVEPLLDAESAERCKNYGVPSLQPYLAFLMHLVYDTYFKPSHSKQVRLNQAISELDQPILFIHAENDLFVPIHNVYPLIDLAKNPTAWFVKNSSHVNNHLKYKEEYTVQMQRFIQTSLGF